MKIEMKKFITVILLLALGLFGVVNFAYGDTESDSINVQMTVPAPVIPPGDPGVGGGDAAPVISDVVSTTAVTTAIITWAVTDDKGLDSVTFNYSADMSYSLTAYSTGTYTVNLSGLTQQTIYYFKITAIDTATNMTVYTGSFKTSSDTVTSLKIYAKPEKRVPKAGGNLALDATVIFYDPATQHITHTLTAALDKTGSSTLSNVTIPNGANLQAILKGQSHLAKKIIGVNIQNGQNITLDFTDSAQFELLAGDVQGTGLKDNFIDILDVSAEDVKYNTVGLNEDLNRDGVADILDMSIILVNFNKAGAAVPS